MQPMANRGPVGPGSRGGRWHEPEYRRAYHRLWRMAHPEYREREALRRARERAQAHGDDPADIVAPRLRSLPTAAARCICPCGCRAEVPLTACGFCRLGEHEETA